MKELTKMSGQFWKWFRGLPPGLQVVGWIFFAPVATATYLLQRPGGGRATKIVALVLLAGSMKTFNIQMNRSRTKKKQDDS